MEPTDAEFREWVRKWWIDQMMGSMDTPDLPWDISDRLMGLWAEASQECASRLVKR